MKKYVLPRKLGDEMVLVVFEEICASVLILTKRKEGDADAYIEIGDERFSIISLHRPPETCGINEASIPPDEALSDFVNALKSVIETVGIQTLYLARAHKWQGSRYAEAFPSLIVKDIEGFPEIGGVKIISQDRKGM